MKNYRDLAMQNFKDGYNCCQAVALAFSAELNIDAQTLLRLASSFGGGMGRLREVCGAVSGMFMVAGLKCGYDYPSDDKTAKMQHYALIQNMADEFKQKNGSIVCRELLKSNDTNPTPDTRTPDYYKKRPCVELVGDAAEIAAKLFE